MTKYQGHCPECGEMTEIHESKPWVGDVCTNCGHTIDQESI